MNKSDLKQQNPRLYYDMVASGKIPYSEAGALAWGAPVTNLFTEAFLLGPHAPDHRQIVKPTDFSAPTQFAESGAYPKPWRSAAQKTTNAIHTTMGPYAALVGWIEGNDLDEQVNNLCNENNKFDKIKPTKLFGRWGIATSGPTSGQAGFFLQDWYSPSEGTYDANYWNNYFDSIGAPRIPPWQLRTDWWESIDKTTILTYVEQTGLVGLVQVAWRDIDFDDADYFPGLDISGIANASYDLLTVMVSLAAITRWL